MDIKNKNVIKSEKATTVLGDSLWYKKLVNQMDWDISTDIEIICNYFIAWQKKSKDNEDLKKCAQQFSELATKVAQCLNMISHYDRSYAEHRTKLLEAIEERDKAVNELNIIKKHLSQPFVDDNDNKG